MIIRKTNCLLLLAGLLLGNVAQAAAEMPRYFGASAGSLAQTKARLATGDAALRPALAALLVQGDNALGIQPPSVTKKKKLGASGDPHDYYSQAPYAWPDPAKPDGLPYLERDGQVNPESRGADNDFNQIGVMGKTVTSLALAYYFTGDESYAAHAGRCLRVWFLDPATKMNPHMNQAQAIPGRNTGRGIGIIEAGGIVDAGDAAGLLAGSPHWPETDDAALRAWLTEFLDWLQTSKPGRSEANERQNHGTMYDARVTRLALALGRTDLAKQMIEAAKTKRIAVQIEPDGRQPLELRRTKSFEYSSINLRGLCTLAVLGGHVGVDLWSYETPDKRSIRRAIEFMYPYVADASKPWPYTQISAIQRSSLAGALRQAAVGYHEPRYEALAMSLTGSVSAPFQLLHLGLNRSPSLKRSPQPSAAR